ncbi:MAG: hypothetical protein IPH77_17485 [Ignavibacteria bacterium]|nr:hypothetical protein [Ignavibacteria bacterium]
MYGNTGVCGTDGTRAHRSRILEYPRDQSGNYNNYIWHKVGMTNYNPPSYNFPYKNNSSGGVDFEYGIPDSVSSSNNECDSMIVGTGDFLYNMRHIHLLPLPLQFMVYRKRADHLKAH